MESQPWWLSPLILSPDLGVSLRMLVSGPEPSPTWSGILIFPKIWQCPRQQPSSPSRLARPKSVTLEFSFVVDENIGWFEITVQYLSLMGVMNRFRNDLQILYGLIR